MRDDLIPEEHDVVYEAMKRLSDREMFDRTFRLRRAVQLDATKGFLPREEWIRPEDVTLNCLACGALNHGVGCPLFMETY